MRALVPLCAAVLIAASLVALPAAAHHSAKIFDADTVLALPGTVTRFSWTNPHTYIYVETTDDNGEPVEWEIETDAIPILVRSGWSRGSFAPGERVLARARPTTCVPTVRRRNASPRRYRRCSSHPT